MDYGVMVGGDLICEPGLLAFDLEALPATERVDTRDMVFILDGFQVSCNDMPAYLEQGEIVRCEMDDFVTEDLLVLDMHGFPSAFGESLEFGCPSPCVGDESDLP